MTKHYPSRSKKHKFHLFSIKVMAIANILRKSIESIAKSLELLVERESLFTIAESRGEDRTVERQKLAEQHESLMRELATTNTELEKAEKREEAESTSQDE